MTNFIRVMLDQIIYIVIIYFTVRACFFIWPIRIETIELTRCVTKQELQTFEQEFNSLENL